MSITPHVSGNYTQELFDTIALKFEKFEPEVYADTKGVPTIGYGYALVTKNKITGIWEIRGGNDGIELTADLAAVGKTLQPSDTKLLNDIVAALNAGDKATAKSLIGDGSGFSFSLTEPEAHSLFNNIIPSYEDIVKSKFRNNSLQSTCRFERNGGIGLSGIQQSRPYRAEFDGSAEKWKPGRGLV